MSNVDDRFLDYVNKIIDRGFFDTGDDIEVFWSNDYRQNEAGEWYRHNEKLANDSAIGNPDIAVVKEGAVLIDNIWQKDFRFEGEEISIAARNQATSLMSKSFANLSAGTVAIYVNYSGAGSYFRSDELPILMQNNKVADVNFVDADGVNRSASKADWYEWQRQQWVDGRIEKLEQTVDAWEKDVAADIYAQPELNKYAVGDFAKEVVNSYKNMTSADRPDYIDVAKERGYIKQLNEAVDNISNPHLKWQVVQAIEKELNANSLDVSMFRANMSAIGDDLPVNLSSSSVGNDLNLEDIQNIAQTLPKIHGGDQSITMP